MNQIIIQLKNEKEHLVQNQKEFQMSKLKYLLIYQNILFVYFLEIITKKMRVIMMNQYNQSRPNKRVFSIVYQYQIILFLEHVIGILVMYLNLEMVLKCRENPIRKKIKLMNF